MRPGLALDQSGRDQRNTWHDPVGEISSGEGTRARSGKEGTTAVLVMVITSLQHSSESQLVDVSVGWDWDWNWNWRLDYII